MDGLEVIVGTGEERIYRFSPEKEAQRLAEIEAAMALERQERIAGVKAQLLDAMSDLEHAKVLKTEGVFSAEDVAAAQGRVDDLKAELAVISPSKPPVVHRAGAAVG